MIMTTDQNMGMHRAGLGAARAAQRQVQKVGRCWKAHFMAQQRVFSSLMALMMACSSSSDRSLPLGDVPEPPGRQAYNLLALDGRPLAWCGGHGQSMAWFADPL